MARWQDVNGIYQIYPRSFKDANGDGTGDLAGIIEKLDYIKNGERSLGIDAIWLSPFYPSPMADFGYDISDYRGVDPLFGTLDDFKKLIEEAHKRDIKVMVDFVPNHTSDEHPWFLQSKSSKENSRRDWYVWKDPKPDGSPPNNWLSVFGGSAWEFDDTTGQYYLHSYLAKQPDLNWENPEVREAMCDVIRYWIELGVDGIRADAVRWIAKDPEFRDNPPNPNFIAGKHDPYHSQYQRYTYFNEQLFDYLAEMAAIVEEYPDHIILFEDYPDPTQDWWSQHSRYYEVSPSVAAPFNFKGMFTPYSAPAFREFIGEFEREMGAWLRPFYCFGNHDNPRLASRFGVKQARLIGLMLLTLPGIPVVYNGDELGMENGDIAPDQIKDPFELQTPGLGLGRDPGRTPIQWTNEKYAGFSNVEPWLPVSKNVETINVASEFSDEASTLNLYKSLLKLRKRLIIRSGGYEEWNSEHEKVFGYIRHDGDERLLILLNMTDEETTETLNEGGSVIISTHLPLTRIENHTITLQPHQGVVIQLI